MQEVSFTRLNHKYIAGMRPILRKQALYSDTTANYISPAQPSGYDQVQVRFRTYINNVDKVILVNGPEKITMEKTDRDELFDYYSTNL